MLGKASAIVDHRSSDATSSIRSMARRETSVQPDVAADTWVSRY